MCDAFNTFHFLIVSSIFLATKQQQKKQIIEKNSNKRITQARLPLGE
jgi:hypothetical protein